MGLDMFFVQDPAPLTGKGEVLHRMRNHPDLHGWMCSWWMGHEAPKDSQPWDFCGVPLRITPKLLVVLRNYLDVPNKVTYVGPFWGESSAEKWARTSEIISDLESRIQAGDCIYYIASW